MRKRRFLAAAACAAAVAGVVAGSAVAGEITGNGKDTAAPEHAQSICAFSGQNHAHPGEPPSRVQSYGQLVSAGYIDPSQVKSGDPSPGTACNGHSGYLAGGGG